MMVIDNKFEIGQEVWLRTDVEQFKRFVTSIIYTGSQSLLYELSLDEKTSRHYDFEISDKEITEMKVR